MGDRDIVMRLLAKNFELEDQLSNARAASDYWREKAEKSIPAEPLSEEETFKALANATIPKDRINYDA